MHIPRENKTIPICMLTVKGSLWDVFHLKINLNTFDGFQLHYNFELFISLHTQF